VKVVFIYGDIPVACTTSGSVSLLDAVVEGGPEDVKAMRVVILNGLGTRFDGIPCAACRSTPSTSKSLERRSTCEWRPLVGPLFVPKQSGA
jgi:hypothetical protein